MPLAPLAPPFLQPNIQKMLGPLQLSATEAADATLTGAQGTNLVLAYRDVTLSGNTTMTGILVCRTLDLGGFSLSANALGPNGGAGNNQHQSGYGVFDYSSVTSAPFACTAAIAPTTAIPYDMLESLLALGGVGANGGAANTGNIGANAAAIPIDMFIYMVLFLGVRGGGGGSAGGQDSVGGASTGGVAGRRGLSGGAGSNTQECSGGGGSGIAGGGSGGGCNGGIASSGDAGGAGGGYLIVICDAIIGTAGTISANGGNGTDGSLSTFAGGGGGGGGLAVCFARSVLASPTMQANGGTGGIASNIGGAGGNGGSGVAALITG